MSIKRSVLHQHCAQISKFCFSVHFTHLVTSTYYQTLACKQITFGIEMVIQGDKIFCTLEMTLVQAFVRHRNKLALVACGSTAFRKPRNWGIPEEILLAIHCTLDIRLQVFILMNWNSVFEVVNRINFPEIVFLPDLGVLCRCNKI